ncbi:MAG: glycosyltransferase family 2 protein [Microcella sp.]|uniref:glycosyltransferase family 2 protein n=1 Tax=Microcella sp. TaxID=1913979 RepID=UPI0024C9B68A|nr:glycosyltransferase family 2 protein [Microcella sp.]UYN82582.1 MAG: glycosyltransferase family 2 protein [Microcella sp.]
MAVPALNEAEAIGGVLDALSRVHPMGDIVIIDDGSRDATAIIARTRGASVVSHAINLGVGAAMGTAFKYAVMHKYDAVVQFDGDGQHRPEHISELVAALVDADVVIGSRFAEGGTFKSSAARRGVQRLISWVVSAYARTRITDATSGFRIAGPRALAVFSEHYPVEWLGDTVESIVMAARQNLTVREIPVVMNERAGGAPSQSILRATLYTGRILLILGLASVRSAPPQLRAMRRADAREVVA